MQKPILLYDVLQKALQRSRMIPSNYWLRFSDNDTVSRKECSINMSGHLDLVQTRNGCRSHGSESVQVSRKQNYEPQMEDFMFKKHLEISRNCCDG